MLGLVLAAALVRVMATLLFGVSQHDPGTFAVVALLMLAVGIDRDAGAGVSRHPRRSDRHAALGVSGLLEAEALAFEVEAFSRQPEHLRGFVSWPSATASARWMAARSMCSTAAESG